MVNSSWRVLYLTQGKAHWRRNVAGCEKKSIISLLIYMGVIITHLEGRNEQNINTLLCMFISIFLPL